MKISNIMKRLVARKENVEANENGFSLIELVVAIGILLVLSVGGLIGYSQITNNAREAAVQSAASDTLTGVMARLSDNNGTNDIAELNTIVAEYNNNYGTKINVTATPTPTTPTTAYPTQVIIKATHTEGTKPVATITGKL